MHARSASMGRSRGTTRRGSRPCDARGAAPLTGADGATLVEALAGWIRPRLRSPSRAARLHARRSRGPTRSTGRAGARLLSASTGEHAFIAAVEMGPVIRVIALEMFRIGTGLRLKGFAHEAEARAWLRGQGIPA